MEIRPFTPDDRDAVVDLSLRAWEPVFASIEQALHGSGVFEAHYPDWRASQRAAVQQACTDLSVWVAELDGVVAGFVAVHLHQDDRMGEIHMVAVDPPFQGRGIASRLTDLAVGWMGEQGMTTAMVETGGDPGHAPARATYARAGPVQIARARELVPAARFVEADAAGVAFAAGTFDAAVCLYTLIHLPHDEQRTVIGNLHTWLRPGGVLLATVGATELTGQVADWLGGGAPMWWSHPDVDVSRGWFGAAGFVLERDEFVPEGDGGHQLFLARRPSP